MQWKTLSKESSLLFKGVAIVMIMVHNFMHLFPLPKENEFDFSIERTESLFYLLWNEPENSIRVLFSFYGHFGVQVFIFLSAYGLTKKYTSSQPIYWTFIWQRITKIYPVFLLAIALWLILEGFYSYGILGPFKMLYWNIEDILLKVTLISNFIPEKSLSPVGPWWFIPFIFQFYFLFPFILKAYEKWKESALIFISIFCLVLMLVTNGEIAGVQLYFTVIGHMLTLSLGIYLAKKDDVNINIPISFILVTLVIHILGNMYESFWHLSHFSFVILFLVFLRMIKPRIKGVTRKILLFMGSISMTLFLVNGYLRYPMIRWAMDYDYWLVTLFLCLLFLIGSTIVAVLMQKTEKTILKGVNRFRKT